ncbi:MAG TPA: CYTH domain-containing protein [Mesorhizobium sp.]|nr:CYTH domain-containing protein [Mesorhizobium sp.]
MGREIERKFLVRHDGWRAHAAAAVGMRQAYLASTPALSMRIRLRDDGLAFLTIKSAGKALERAEYEYPIPPQDAEELIALSAGRVLSKRRHEVLQDGLRWEVDVFDTPHEGLVLAELEMADAAQVTALPDWVGEEVTGDPRFYNEALAATLPER